MILNVKKYRSARKRKYKKKEQRNEKKIKVQECKIWLENKSTGVQENTSTKHKLKKAKARTTRDHKK